MRSGLSSVSRGRSCAEGGADVRLLWHGSVFSGRRAIKRLTGSYKVPTLVLDDGSIVDESQNIVAWAEANPAGGYPI